MSPLASVFLPSYNKTPYVADAIGCILAQDQPDFELWILENSTDPRTREVIAPFLTDPRIRYEEIELTPEEREQSYPTALLLNRYYGKAAGEYIFYLSDDDLMESSCIRLCTEFLGADPVARQVCYFGLRMATAASVGLVETGAIPATIMRGHGTGESVDSRIDGGQIAHRRDCLDQIPQPWFPETSDHGTARHCDGIFMEKLAEHYTFWPLQDTLVTHRRTPLSTWDKG